MTAELYWQDWKYTSFMFSVRDNTFDVTMHWANSNFMADVVEDIGLKLQRHTFNPFDFTKILQMDNHFNSINHCVTIKYNVSYHFKSY